MKNYEVLIVTTHRKMGFERTETTTRTVAASSVFHAAHQAASTCSSDTVRELRIVENEP